MRKLFALIGVLAMLGAMLVPVAVFAADDSDTTTVAGNPTAVIDTTITGTIANLSLAVGATNEDLTSIDMNVKCNTGTQN